MAGACSCKSCCLGGLLPPEKQMAGACSCKSVALEACCGAWRVWTAVCPASNISNPPAGLSKATTLTATCPSHPCLCHLFFCCLPSVFQGVQDCRLPGFKPFKPSRRPFQGNNSYSYMPLPSVFQGVQKPGKRQS